MKKPRIQNPYQIGDWVSERGPTGKLSPAMYIVSMWKDILYLEIDPEQGDPFEVDLADVVPIPLTEEWLQSQDCLGLQIGSFKIEAGKAIVGFMQIVKDKDKDIFILSFHSSDEAYTQMVFIRYVHELQHFFQMFGIDKELRL